MNDGNSFRAIFELSATRATPVFSGHRPDAWLDQEMNVDGIPLYRGVELRFDGAIAPGEHREVVAGTRAQSWRSLKQGEVIDLYEGRTRIGSLKLVHDWRPDGDD